MTEKYTLSCLVENHFGVLARISGLISARAFNIDSLTVSATEDPSVSRMTIVVDMVAPGKPSHQMIGTFESLKADGAKPQHRHIDKEADLSLS